MTFLKITLHTSCLSGLWLIYFYNSIFLPLTRLLCYFCTDSQTATAASLKLDRNSSRVNWLNIYLWKLIKERGPCLLLWKSFTGSSLHGYNPFWHLHSHISKMEAVYHYPLFFWILLKIHISVHVKGFVIKERSESVQNWCGCIFFCIFLYILFIDSI